MTTAQQAGPGAVSPAGGPGPDQGSTGSDAVARMGRAGGLSMVGAAFSAVGGVATTALITNAFDRSDAGAVFASTALFLVATAIVQLGTEVGVVRAIPTLVVHGRGRHARTVLVVALVPVLVVAVLAAVAGYLGSSWLAAQIVGASQVDATAAQLRVLALLLPVAAIGNVLLAVTRGFRTQLPTVVVDSLGRVGLQLAGVGIVMTLGLGTVAVVFAWSIPYAVSLVLIGLWAAMLLRRQQRRDARAAAEADPALAADLGHDGGSPETFAGFWRFTGPRAIATTSQMALKRSDILLVSALQSTAEAALYAAGSRFVVVGQIGVQALQQALSPQLSAMFARRDMQGVAEVFRATTAWSMFLAWPLYLVCAGFAPELLLMFGSDYPDAAPVVVILCLTMLVATASGAVDSVLLMSGRTWASLGNNVGALVLNVGLNVVLIPRYGAVGAAVAWAIAIVIRNILPLVQVHRAFGVSPLSKGSLVIAASSTACFGLLPLAVRLTGAGRLWVAGSAVVGSVVYLGIAFAFRSLLNLAELGAALRSVVAKGRGRKGGKGGQGSAAVAGVATVEQPEQPEQPAVPARSPGRRAGSTPVDAWPDEESFGNLLGAAVDVPAELPADVPVAADNDLFSVAAVPRPQSWTPQSPGRRGRHRASG